MSESQFTNCPGCGRHCPLSNPGCERGEAFAKNGVIPGRGNSQDGPRHGRHLYEEMDTDGKLLWTLHSLGRYLHEFHEGRASQARVLGLLSEVPSVTQRALTERLGVQPGTASEVFGKLESAGLIERAPSEADRRTWELRLTESGRAAAQLAGEERKERREAMFACLSDEQRGQLLSLLEALNADWEQRFGRPRGPRHGGKGMRYEEGEVHGLPHRRPHGGEEDFRPLPHHPGRGEGAARPMPHHPRHGEAEEGSARPLPHRPHGGDHGDGGPKIHNL